MNVIHNIKCKLGRIPTHKTNEMFYYFFPSLLENSICKIASEKEEVFIAKHLVLNTCDHIGRNFEPCGQLCH